MVTTAMHAPPVVNGLAGDAILRNDLAPEDQATRNVTTATVKPPMVATPVVCGSSAATVVSIPNEACDDGNDEERDACRSNCIIAECGDGILRNDLEANQAGFEACDDGNGVNTDSCLNDCREASCGDEVVQAGEEECDDGNQVEDDGCDNT